MELQSASTRDAASLKVSYELPTVTDEKDVCSVYPEGGGTIRGESSSLQMPGNDGDSSQLQQVLDDGVSS